MNAISLVKNSLIRAGNLSLRDMKCACCREATREALEICKGLNTPSDFHSLLTHRTKSKGKSPSAEGNCPTYEVTTHEIALVYERLRVLWRLGPVSLHAVKDVTEIIDGVVSRN